MELRVIDYCLIKLEFLTRLVQVEVSSPIIKLANILILFEFTEDLVVDDLKCFSQVASLVDIIRPLDIVGK